MCVCQGGGHGGGWDITNEIKFYCICQEPGTVVDTVTLFSTIGILYPYNISMKKIFIFTAKDTDIQIG